VGLARPATVPFVLVFPLLGVADAGLGLDVVEPGVLDTGAAGPDVLAGHAAGVAADALVQVQHHADLCSDFHRGFLVVVLLLRGSHPAIGRPPPGGHRAVCRASPPWPSCAPPRTRRGWCRWSRSS